MAIAGYSTDLQTFDLIEGSTTFGEFTGYTSGSKEATADTDFPIQGNNHVSAEQRTTGQGSIGIDYGSNITWTSGWNIFLWGIFLAPAAVNSDANGGIVMMIGSGTGDFYKWTVGGNDFGRYPYGGWQNFVADPEVTTGRTTTGSPGTNYRWAGVGYDVISAISKGSPLGLDAIRYGRGELRVINGQAGSYGTFVGMAAANDANTARWGLFKAEPGVFLWKGLISLGTTTAVDFRDANRYIVIDNSRRVASTFNAIEVNHASSNVEWTAISIASDCTQSPGSFEAVDNATIDKTSCTFTDMGTFTYQSNSTCTFNIYRRCGLVTQDGATFDGCTFDESSATVAMEADDPGLISNCIFNSDGTGHAIEITTPGTYSFDSNVFTGYASSDGSTGNEAIYNNSGGLVTINLTGTGVAPSVRNGTSATTAVNKFRTLTLGTTGNLLKVNTEVRIYKTSDDSVIDGVENSGTTFAYQFNYTADTPIYVHLINETHIWERLDLTLVDADLNIPISQRVDRFYENPV